MEPAYNENASGSGSVVEHLLAKEGVAGSNPVFRSISIFRYNSDTVTGNSSTNECRTTLGDALTHRSAEWERLVGPVCGRCLALLRSAGDKGRRLKGTGETSWLGHGVGLFRNAQEHY